jgi:hypothetical protein
MKYFLTAPIYYINTLFSRINNKYTNNYNSLKDKGFFIIEDFINDKFCDELSLKIDNLINNDIYSWQDVNKSDTRIFGVEKAIPESIIFNEEINVQIYNKYIGRIKNSFIMANKVLFKENNLGSGGGWHRDSISRKQLKFILYLNDVTCQNGCFQYLESTQKLSTKFKFNLVLNKNCQNTRFTNDEVEFLIEKYNLKLINFEAKKGTLIAIDTSGIHRGNPIENGVRYALTNYIFDTKMPLEIEKMLI